MKREIMQVDKLDILNRDTFVEKVLHLLDNISGNKSSVCFAINGQWGCGKSFVLDMLEEQLNVIQSEETHTDKYFVIRYNCWEYDYYEEPLIAIVATMISIIEEKTKLFPDGKEKQEILGVLKEAGIALLSMVTTAIKKKTGKGYKCDIMKLVLFNLTDYLKILETRSRPKFEINDENEKLFAAFKAKN